MESRTMRVQSRITPEVFREFALFDTFRRQKRHRRPLVFMVIMLAFAAACFAQAGRRESAALLGGVLAGVGVILPAVYILLYLNSVRAACRKLKEAGSPLAYELELAPACARAIADGKGRDYPWKKLHGAYRLKRSVCLYVTPQQAYILPDTGDEGHERQLWELIAARMPEGSCRDLRK